MRRNPKLFTPEEFNFLHTRFLKEGEEPTKVFQKIKQKKGYDLDKREIDLIKRRFEKWKSNNPGNY